MHLHLDQYSALVTGAHRGTGQVIARQLADEGARVLLHGFTAEQASAASAGIPGATAVHGDLLTDAGAADLWAQVQDHGGIDILVNNHGRAARGSFTTSSTADWLEMIEENLLCAVRLVRHALPELRGRGWGRIINLGTIGSTRPAARNPHYYAAKGALATMTRSLALAAANCGTTVNLVSPGIIRTPEVEADLLRRAQREGWGDTFEDIEARAVAAWFPNPLGRLATREEVADLVTFVASPRAGFIHGQDLRIDGGALGLVS